jgi:NADPH-dependent ferric siderophore reductase
MSKPMHQVRVAAVSREVPDVVSIDFEPGGLAARECVDDHVKILLPPPGADHGAPVPLDLPSDPPSRAAAPLMRTYTRRRVDPATGAWGIDVFLFPHGGPGARWAASTRAGDVVTVRGPGGHWRMPEHPGTVLMAGDTVALPAISNALEALPADASAFVLVEEGPHDYPLPRHPGARILRVGSSRGGEALVDAVRDLDAPSGEWWAFVHGQADMVRPLRRHLRLERGLPKDHLLLSAYWISGRDAEDWRAMKSDFNREMDAESGD